MSNMTEYGFMKSLDGCELRHQPNGELHIIPPEGGKIGTNISSLILAAHELLEALQELHHECIQAALRAGTRWPLSAPSQIALDGKCRAAITKATR